MALKYTRRQIAVGLAVAAPALAQTPATQPAVDDTAAAKALIKKNLDLISNVKVPVATEPSFIFKA